MSANKRNPLRKRFARELRSDFGKYAVIFLLILMSISFVSGFLVADNSMIIAYNEGFEKYHVEDGHFRVRNELNNAQKKQIAAAGVSLYPLYYSEEELVHGGKMRIYPIREEVNLICLMKGELPQTNDEIAVDRMYADNNGLTVGDAIEAMERTWKISGLVALPDYSCLFENNSDMMFDSVMFGVGVITQNAFDSMEEVTYNYAWTYNTAPVSPAERSEEFLKELREIVTLEDYVPQYENQAITFTGEDMGSDKAMMEALLYIIMGIVAFVFTVTIKDTIRKESSVIGTLLASGYTRRELFFHYMTMPAAVTIAAALVGNILGYTVFKEVAADMYYGSYSLPTYVTVWNSEAFWKTTLIPCAIMVIVTGVALMRALRLSPLRFLRHDLSGRKNRRAFFLPHHLPILSRYRLRIVLQNLGSYALLFVGILFANMLMMFGMQLPKLLEYFEESITGNLIARYQYVLNVPLSLTDSSSSSLKQLGDILTYFNDVETENSTAEKFSAYVLETPETPGIRSDEVMLYGIDEHSRYIQLPMDQGQFYISSAYAEKYSIHTGDTITLLKQYSDEVYEFHVDGVADYMGAVVAFLPKQDLNRIFDLGDSTFVGYFSDTPITDIPKEYIGTVIDEEALTKTSRQLEVSMGDMMYMVDGFAVIMYLILIYLLSRMIIEKNANAISLTKILGYTDGEVSLIYIVSTTIVVILSMVLSVPILSAVMVPVFENMMREMISGWLPIHMDSSTNILTVVIGITSYAVVALLEYRKIRMVAMEEALKNVE
ncbi:MAG: ABC transporter permease [Solobacterium sp.]|nr:ABC transporter permease [Solobacterium sp.]